MELSDFEIIWTRIKSVTSLKTLKELAELVGSSQPNISFRKKEGSFPPEWAFKVASKYRISTDWIMTGIVEKNSWKGSDDPEVIKQIREWILEQERKEPGALAWFKYDFRKKYPEFDRWEKREEGGSDEHNKALKSNIA